MISLAREVFLGHELRQSTAKGVVHRLQRRRQRKNLAASTGRARDAHDPNDENVSIEIEELRVADLDV